MLNSKLVDDLVEPDFVDLKIPLTEHIFNDELTE